MQTSKEIWKDIPNYENFYQASSFGRIRSVDRYNINSYKNRCIYGQNLKLSNDRYSCVFLSKNGKAVKFTVHYLIAITFLKKKKHCNQINHIDANKRNNKVSNLEWCTMKQNMQHAHKNGLYKNSILKKSKSIKQYDLNNKFLCKYASIMDAERKTKIPNNNIVKVAKGKRNTAGGYIWKY